MGVIWMMLIGLGLLLFLWLHERGIQRNCQRYKWCRRTYQTTNKMTLLLLQLWDGDNDPGRQQRRLQERELWLLRQELRGVFLRRGHPQAPGAAARPSATPSGRPGTASAL